MKNWHTQGYNRSLTSLMSSFLPFRTTFSIYKMIEGIITLTKESEYKSRQIALEKRKADVLLYDVSRRVSIFDTLIK